MSTACALRPGNLLSVFSAQQALPPAPPEGAFATELTRLAATAIAAWEEADFDAFAALASKTVAISVPGYSDKSMQSVWQARMDEGTSEGILSIDTVMAQADDEDHASLMCILHCHDTESSGMALKHSWVKVRPRGGASQSQYASQLAFQRGAALS